MSFDLFILIEKIDKTTQRKWVEKLKEKGFDCKFPDGFIINEDFVGEITVLCQFNPPLVKQKTGYEECEFYFEPISIDKDFQQDAIESTIDEYLQLKLAKMKHELSIHCSANTSKNSILLECFAAATLAEVSDGVLFDPQKFGAVVGDKNYHVAKYHSDVEYQNVYIKNQQDNRSTPKKIQTTIKQNINLKSMSTNLIVLLFFLFIAIRHIITK